MRHFAKRYFIALIALIGLGGATPAMACCDMGATVAAIVQMNISVVASINAMNSSVSELLGQIGSAVNANGSKVSAAIEANGNADRSLAVRQHMDDRIQNAADSFSVPDSVCADSASGGMREVAAAASGGAGSMRGGGGVKAGNAAVDKAVNSPAIDPTADQRRSTSVHALYCDTVDYASYGGSKLCPQVSSMPGGDKRMDSVVNGAGQDGKAPDLTFSPDQIDAARMYMQNSTNRSIGRDLSKGEATSPKGIEYAGLRTQYQSEIDAAAYPQRQGISEHQANSATAALLKDALQAPSAQSYFNATASSYAKQVGYVSYAELEQFEVGRRYANTQYQADLQAMNGDNLAREQIRIAALNAYLLLEVKNELRSQSIIQGLMLASQAHQEYAPLFQAKLQELDSSLGRAQ
jgi:hypothetical protein